MIRSFAACAVALAGLSSAAVAASPASPAPSGTSLAVPACASASLELAIATLPAGAAKADGLEAFVTNVSGGACALARRPVFTLADATHHPVPIVEATFAPSGRPASARAETVLLRPSARASAVLRWTAGDPSRAGHCAEATEVAFFLPQALTLAGHAPLPLLAPTPARVRVCGPPAPAAIAFAATPWALVDLEPGPHATSTGP